MNKLWIYGDSFSIDFSMVGASSGEDYIKWKGYVPKTYPNYVAERLSLEMINFAEGGMDNYTIMEKFCENLNEYKKGDMVIIGWGPKERFRVVDEINDKWMTVSNFIPNENQVSLKTVQEIRINRIHDLYNEEVKNWSKLIKFALKDILFYSWSWTWIHLHDFEEIRQETNNEIRDGHWSENGHKLFADIIFKDLNI